MTTLSQFRLFFAWEDEKEEEWLGAMAQKGWHFVSVSGLGRYTFEQGEPRNMAYRMDFLPSGRDKAEYVQIFLDAGWEYAGQAFNGWQYFRKEALRGEAPEIFSDNESKALKYRSVLLILVATLPIFVVSLNNLAKLADPFWQAATFLLFLIVMLDGYAIVRLGLRVSQLTRKV